MNRRTSRRLRAPIVTTAVLTGAPFLVACGGKAVVDPSDPVVPATPLECPTAQPAVDSPCPTFDPTVDGEELACFYSGGPEGCGKELRCVPDGTWQDTSPTCNPPAPLECPVDVPVSGVACPPFGPLDGPNLVCTYTTSSPCLEEYTCTSGATWQNTSPTCNPAPPCASYSDEMTCVAQGCAWNGMVCGDLLP